MTEKNSPLRLDEPGFRWVKLSDAARQFIVSTLTKERDEVKSIVGRRKMPAAVAARATDLAAEIEAMIAQVTE